MRRIPFAVLAATALVAVGCEKKQSPAGGSDQSGTPTPSKSTPAPGGESGGTGGPQEDSVILLGEVGSLTGSEATFGISTRDGIDLAITEVNAQGGVKGRQVAVRVYDSQSKPEEAGNAALRLITQDRVKIVLGEVASSNSLAMAEKAQEARVPMITPSSTAVSVTEKGDYIFRVCFIDPFQGFVMAKFAREHLKVGKVAVLKDTKAAYSIGLADVFTRKFTEMGGKIVASEAFQKGDTDFRAQLTAIKRQKPEAIYVPGYYSDVGLIARQARELGLRVPLLGGDGWDSPKLMELGGSSLEGSYFSNHYSPEDPAPRVQKFIADFRAKTGQVPDSMAALGYDAAWVAADAMKRAPDLSSASIRKAIADTKGYPGVTGTITLDEHRNALKPAVVLQVSGGKFKYVTTISP